MQPPPVGTRRVLALAVLLAAVAAVAYLEKAMAGSVDVQLVYFLIVLTGAVLLPRAVALAVAAGAAVVSSGISGDGGVVLALNVLTHFMIYGYAALLTSNWEHERRRLMKMSRIDELTGLHNLRALREQLPVWLGPAVRTRRPMAILMVDVDGFKSVNDRLGHASGNELLKEVASLLRLLQEPGGAVVEDRLGDGVIAGLERRGHRITRAGDWTLGRLSAVVRDPRTGVLQAAANPRGAQGYAAGR